MQENLRKMFLTALPMLIVGLGLFFVILLHFNMQERNREADTYIRFQGCSLNIPPNIKTQEKIDSCWRKVQASTGVTVDHFSE